MAEKTSYAPGSFCWCELVTTDQPSAKKFYASLFGWQGDDQEFAPGQYYTMLNIGGKSVGALYGMDQAQLDRKVPPHWNLYVAVANADEATKKAASLGAKVMMEPFDVMDVGRMSVVQDPTGAALCLWEAKQHHGAGLINEVGTFCWYELNTKDTEAAKTFYTSLFGWAAGGDANYTEWKQAGESIGGMMEIKPEWGPVPPNWLPYIWVEDCDATTAKAKAEGGSIMMAPDDIPNMGRFAVLADPQHAVFAIYQPKKA